MIANQTFCKNSDNLLGPGVKALFQLLLPARLETLRRASFKVSTFRLTIPKFVSFVITLFKSFFTTSLSWKILSSALFSPHMIYAVSLQRSSSIQTKLGMTADTPEIIASAAAVLLSLVEDQCSIEPSVLLAIYFSGLAVLTIPQLRSLWLIPSINLYRGLLIGITF
jgi:ATP-binding cassette subfamily C (CFTR/MRP) protein 1